MKFKVILVLIILILILLFDIHAKNDKPTKAVEPSEKLIDVGQCRLNFKVISGSKLTILFESGGGMDSSEWTSLAKTVAHRTGATIITYDRAGFGKSDLPEIPYDMRQETKWLFYGLKRLGITKNLILVGHSYGGWLIRLAVSMYPKKILGMVFIDPFSNEFVDILGIEYLKDHPMAGKLPFDTSKPEKLNKIQLAMVRMVSDGLRKKIEIMRNTTLPEGIPVRLITAGNSFLPKPEEQTAWRKAHEQLVTKIKGAKLIVAERSGHMVPFQQPELIIDTIIEIIKLTK